MTDQGIIKLSVRSLDRGQFSYELAPNTTVAGLKEKVAADTEYPSDRVRLLHRGRELTEDTQTLAQLNLPEHVVFHCAMRAPPSDQQRRAPAAGGATGGGGGAHGPFVFRGGPGPGGNGPGINFTPGNFMQFMQGGGPGGLGGIFGSVSIGGPGVRVGGGGGPSPDQLNGIQEAVSRMFGGGGPGPGGGGNGGQRSSDNRSNTTTSSYSATPHAGFGAMPFIHPFGPSGQPIPGLSSETAARDGDPILNSNGEYTQRSVFGGLDEMLLRLQNGNMARDSGPALFGITRDSIAPGDSTHAWAQAARTFLRSCRTILSNTSLNRETLAEVNRIFTAAGLQPLALGVRSFPINADDIDDDGDTSNIRDSGNAPEGSEDDDDDDDQLPHLIGEEDHTVGTYSADSSRHSSQNESLHALQHNSDYSSEHEGDFIDLGPQSMMRAFFGSELDATSIEDEDDDDDYEDEDYDEEEDDSDDDWETDDGTTAEGMEGEVVDVSQVPQEIMNLLPPHIRNAMESMVPDVPAVVSEQGLEDEIRQRLQELALAVDGAERTERPNNARNASAGAGGVGRSAVSRNNTGSDSGRIGEDSESGESGNSSGNSSPPPLISDPDEEEPQPRVPPPATRATRGTRGGGNGGGGLAQQQRQGQRSSPSRGRDSTAGTRANVVDSDDSMPALVSEDDFDSDSDRSTRRNVRQRTRAAAPADQQTSDRRRGGGGGGGRNTRADSAWFRAMPDDDLILVAAVTTGELARRFMSVLGQENNPVQENAMIMRVATRLRSLSSLEGVGRMEIARQISLVGGHVTRIAATAADLGRTMEYLHSAFARNNLYFVQMNPGYIGFEDGRAVSNLSIMRTGPNPSDVVSGGFVPGGAFPNMHAVGVTIMPVNVGATGGGAAAAGAGAGNNSGGTGGSSGTGTTNGTRSGQSPNTGPGGRFVFTNVSGPAPAAGGAAPVGQTPAQTSSLASLRTIARHLVNSTVQDIPSLTSEIAAAITGALSQSIPEARVQNTTGAAASVLASRTAQVVDEVVRRHVSHIIGAPEVQQHSQQLRELLGVDIADLARNINILSQTGQQQGEGQQQQEREEESVADLSAPAAAAAATTAAAAPAPREESLDVAGEVRRAWTKRSDNLAAADGAAPGVEKNEKKSEASAEESEKQQGASTSAGQRPRLCGPSLPPRPTAPGGPSLPARKPRAKTATPTPTSAAPTALPAVAAAATASAPAAAAAAASNGLPAGLGDLLGGSGSAGGLGGMLQNMMSNPAIGELARNPSMQQAASQLFGGGGGGGGANGAAGRLDIGALMNSAGPMLSQLMGGGIAASAAPSPSTSASQRASGGSRARRPPPPASTAASSDGDLDVTLAAALTDEEATRWKVILQADDETAQKAAASAGKQQDGEEQGMLGFSDAYLAAMPPRAASGLLQGLLGGQD